MGRSLRRVAAYRISARAIFYFATLFLGLAGTSEVKAFSIRIPSFSVPRISVPRIAPPRISVPHVAPHISGPRFAPRVNALGRGTSRVTSRAAVRSVRHGSSMARQVQHTPGVKRGISLAHRGSNAHHGPTTNEPRQALAPAKAKTQMASRFGSRSRSAAPGHSALCTSSLAGGWVGCGGNVWGHVGSCGHPGTTTTCAPGTWLVLQLPLSPPAPDDDYDWSDDVASPEAPMQVGSDDSPPPPPGAAAGTSNDSLAATAAAGGGEQVKASTNGDCVGPPSGTAFFGIPGNPDQPPLDCGTADQASPSYTNLAALASNNQQDVVIPPAWYRAVDVNQLRMCTALTSGLALIRGSPALAHTRSRARTVNCGDRQGVVGADVLDLPGQRNSIVLHYEGEGAEDLHWVQFVWREQVVTTPNSSTPRPVGGFYRPGGLGGEQRQFTTDPTDPAQVHYYVDMLRPGLREGSPDPKRPFADPLVNPNAAPNYEALGLNCRDEHRAAMIDAPGPIADWKHLRADAPTAISLRLTAHFDSFLVSGGKVCAKVSWRVNYNWVAGMPRFSPPRYELSEPDASGAPPNEWELKVLNYTHPGEEVLK